MLSQRQRTEILAIHYADLRALQYAYMPFLTCGGLFLPCPSDSNDEACRIASYRLDDKLCLLLQFPGTKEKYCCLARVVWIASQRRQRRECRGVGFELSGDSEELRALIEEMLSKCDDSATESATL